MSNNGGLVSKIPDSPMTHSALDSLDAADGVRRAISVTWKSGVGNSSGAQKEHTDDIIVITADHVRYLSRVSGEGWSVERTRTYSNDEEFERMMDEVHDYAVEHSREKMRQEVGQ